MEVVQYDLGRAPSSWDFLQFLINAKIRFDSFAVTFKNGRRMDNMPKTDAQRAALFENVIKPALRLIDATESAAPSTRKMSYFQFKAVNAARKGRTIPRWKVPEDVLAECKTWLNGRSPYVITLREADYFPERNSNLDAWMEFAKSLDDVIFIRDTAKADEPLPFETCPRASKDLLFRAALMSLAKCNFLVANGPVILVEYMEAPWLMFKPLTPELPDYKPGQPDWWKANIGVPVGEQFPWANSQQRIIWRQDDLKSIQDAWSNFNLQEIPAITSISAMSDERRNENVRRNCAANKKRVQDGIEPHDLTATLACYGPSLKETWPLLRNIPDVYCVGASHKFLLDRDIIPSVMIDCDPRARNVDQMGEPHKDVRYWLASCVDPSYLGKLAGHDVALWHLHNGSVSADFIWSIEPEAWLLIGGGSVGLRAISLLYARGYRKFDIHGMDSSYAEGAVGGIQYAGPHADQNPKHLMEVRCGERWFKSNPSLIDYARQFMSDLRLWPGASFKMYGDGLLQEMCKQANQC